MKRIFLILPLLIGCSLFGQKAEGIHQGMVRVQGTVALGIDRNKTLPEQRYYIYGEGEYLLSNHIGVNGDIWANIGSSGKQILGFTSQPSEDGYVHSILAGPVFHAFAAQPFDLYAGIQPGFSLTQVRYSLPTDGIGTSTQFSPTASVHGGVAYYGSFFHLFAQARYVRTQHYSLENSRAFNDLRLCIGLGFNFN